MISSPGWKTVDIMYKSTCQWDVSELTAQQPKIYDTKCFIKAVHTTAIISSANETKLTKLYEFSLNMLSLCSQQTGIGASLHQLNTPLASSSPLRFTWRHHLLAIAFFFPAPEAVFSPVLFFCGFVYKQKWSQWFPVWRWGYCTLRCSPRSQRPCYPPHALFYGDVKNLIFLHNPLLNKFGIQYIHRCNYHWFLCQRRHVISSEGHDHRWHYIYSSSPKSTLRHL